MAPIKAYWFFGDTLRDGGPIPANGEWLEYSGKLILCKSGLHASECPFSALKYAPGPNMAMVDIDGEIVRGDDKLCASRRRIIARFDASDFLWEFARKQALSVIHLWDAPQIVREYLETGDESAMAAARDAAMDAAWDAARDAASDAAMDAACKDFKQAVEDKFSEIING
jgi:hypothetical protein